MSARLAVGLHVWAWVSLLVMAATMGVLGGLWGSALTSLDVMSVSLAAVQSLLWVAAGLVIAVPLGLALSVACELSPKAARLVLPLGAGLASLPPLVFAGIGALGLWALPGLGPVWVAVVLAVAVLPRLTLGLAEVCRLVEPEERLAAVALGASRWQVLSRVVGPGSIGGWLACALRAAATMAGLLAPLLLLPLGQVSSLPVEAFRRAISGDVASAAGMVVVLLVVLCLARGAALMVERRPTWRLR